MAKALLIAEKSSAANEIKNAYNKIKNKYPYEIDFCAASGHLLELCLPDEYKPEWGTPWTLDVLPMIPETFKKRVIPAKARLFNNIKKMYQNGNYDYIINAGDAGREGQLIQMLIYEAIGVDIPILRYWSDDNTEKNIIYALNNLKSNDEYEGLTNASVLRMYFDYLIGMNFSRAASLSLERPVSVGRVMTSTLDMIVERDDEIMSFVPKPYYELEAEFTTNQGDSYKGRLLNPKVKDGNVYAFDDKKILEEISLSDNGSIVEVNEEEKVAYAPSLYNLPDLQKDCAIRYKMRPDKTLSIAQSLYEKKYLSYPRTESKHLSESKKGEIKDVLLSIKSIPELAPVVDSILLNPKNMEHVAGMKKYFNDTKISDHPALTPTSEKPNFDDLEADERKVYELVCKRVLAIYLPPYRTNNTTVITQVDKHKFKSLGVTVKDIGWKTLYKDKCKENILPELTNNMPVSVTKTELQSKKTTPPAYYNDATILIAMETAGKMLNDKELEKVLMECAGLGTPATRAEILKKLETCNYITHNKKGIMATEEGRQLIHALGSSSITSPELTAKWEKKLKDVELGVCSYEDFYQAMISYVTLETHSLSKLNALGPYQKKIGKCKCGRNLIEDRKYFYCEGFLTKTEDGTRLCNVVFPKSFGSAIITETDVINLIKNGTAEVKVANQKNKAKLLYSSEGKLSFSKPDPVGQCPQCKGSVLVGKNGYYCENARKNESGESKCNFSVYKYIGKTEISSSIIKDVLKNGVSSKPVKVTFKKGTTFTGLIKIEEFDGKYRLSAVPYVKERKSICKCPYCADGNIVKTDHTFSCSNNIKKEKTCNFWIYNSFYNTSVSEDEIKALLNHNEVSKKIKFKDGHKKIISYRIDFDAEKNQFVYLKEDLAS